MNGHHPIAQTTVFCSSINVCEIRCALVQLSALKSFVPLSVIVLYILFSYFIRLKSGLPAGRMSSLCYRSSVGVLSKGVKEGIG